MLPALAIGLLAALSTYRARVAAEERAGTEIARSAAAAFQAFADGVLEESLVLGEAIAAGLPPDRVERLLETATRRRPAMRSFSWVSPDGRVLASSNPLGVGFDLSDRDHVRAIAAGRDAALGDLAPSKIDGAPAFAFAQAVRGPGGRLLGVVVASVDPLRLDQRALRISRSGDAAVELRDRAGAVVFRTPRTGEGAPSLDGLDVVVRRALDGEEATGAVTGAGGEAQVAAAVPVAPFGWAAHATRARAEVLGPIRRDLALGLGVGLVLAAAGLAAAIAVAAWIRRGLGALEVHAAALGAGAPPPPDRPFGPLEVARLGGAFDDMAARLVSQRAFFEGVFRAAPIGIAVLSAADLRFRWVNPAYQSFLDEPLRRRPIAGLAFDEVVPGAEEHGVLSALRHVAATGEPVEIPELEFRGFARGTTFWRWSARRLSRDGQGDEIMLLASETTEEVVARRRTEHERRRLETVLRTLPVGVFIADAGGRLLEVNALARRLFGAQAPGPDRIEGLGHLRGVAPESGRPLRARDWPLARAVRDGETVPGELVEVERPDGSRATLLNTAAPIRDARGELTGAVAVVQDLTERIRAEEAVREADRRKSEFLAVLSHELRNPLAPIRTGVALLRQVPPGDPRAGRALEVIERQVGHVTRLVDDLLDVGRIARGKVELRRARLDLADVVRRAAEDHRAELAAHGVALALELPGRALWADGDPVRLAQVVANLLHNAGKFTPAGGRVTVAVAPGAAEHVVSVRDTGAGIAPGLLQRIFEPFAQAEQGVARSAGGLGLGLALVRGLVELHGGAVEARSEGPGRGAELVVRLPAAPPPVALAPAPRPAPADADAEAAARPRRVLVIEDNADAGETLREVLELDGHAVALAGDAAAGLARAAEFRPDVVLCDIGLPDLDGYEVARRLRAGPAAGARLVALTGYALPEDRARAREAGFDEHLAKPPSLDAIRAAVAGTVAAA